VASLPKVTISIPVYNGSNYLDEAIKSAIDQDYENTEIIVVNDGSDDDGATESIAHRYLSRITYLAQENTGVAGAMNTAIRSMTGDFFTWLSHDDLYLPHKTSAQVAYHRRLQKPDAILFSNFHLIDRSGAVTHTSRYSVRDFIDNPMLPLLRGAINGCTLFIPSPVIRAFGPFNERLRYSQDYDLWDRIVSKHDFLLQPDVLVKYRVHTGQDTHKPGFITEGDDLWIRMLESRSTTERVQIGGSTKRFFASRAEFLEKTPFKKAARHAAARAERAVAETLVSVVLPFAQESDLALVAARSVLAQTHRRLQLILVDYGTGETGEPIRNLIGSDVRVLLIRDEQSTLGAARNRGMRAADGEYIAFLGPRDEFAIDKISRQVGSMQDGGKVMSHTSYKVFRPECPSETRIVRAATLRGNVYPRILSECPVAASTVMLHCSLVSAGFKFAASNAAGEEALSWTWIAQRHEVDALDDALSTVEWSDRNGALSPAEQARRTAWLLSEVRADAVHSRHGPEIRMIERSLRELAPSAADAEAEPETRLPSFLNGVSLSSVFPG
jgi:glycosyltransferase involved in cell wall biosynthesis